MKMFPKRKANAAVPSKVAEDDKSSFFFPTLSDVKSGTNPVTPEDFYDPERFRRPATYYNSIGIPQHNVDTLVENEMRKPFKVKRPKPKAMQGKRQSRIGKLLGRITAKSPSADGMETDDYGSRNKDNTARNSKRN